MLSTFDREVHFSAPTLERQADRGISMPKKPRGLEDLADADPRFAAVLIDMQDAHLNHIPNKLHEALYANQISVLRYCAEKDIPVVVLEWLDRGITVHNLSQEIDKVPRHQYLTKVVNNGFDDLVYDGERPIEFASELHNLGATHLFFMGINANACVRDTINGAITNGFKVATSEKVLADRQTYFQSAIAWCKNHTYFSKKPEAFFPYMSGTSTEPL